MIALNELIALNAKPKTRRDNFNRDSSFAKSRGGYVIHSGIHRSTAFISPVDHAECFASFTYWKQYGQAAVNGFIETIIDGGTPEHAEAEACKRHLAGWTVTQGHGCGTQGNSGVTATRYRHGAQERIGGVDYRDLASRCK